MIFFPFYRNLVFLFKSQLHIDVLRHLEASPPVTGIFLQHIRRGVSKYLDTEITCASQAPHNTKAKIKIKIFIIKRYSQDVSTVQDAVFMQYFFVELETSSVSSA